ncbi:MAG: 3-methyladenine DNA glycosylase [Hyphomicrobiales bacterium]|nr:3-methyladenine DNA glycosylase [Hyphomicrobiales bacterium]
MRSFDELFEITANRKGGPDALEKLLHTSPPVDLKSITNDRWLSTMAKCVFQAGFNWKVVDSMWPGFEKAFNNFDIGYCAMLHDDDFDRLVCDKSIVRHGTKIRSVQQNAMFVASLAKQHGSAGNFFASWPCEDFIGLLGVLKKNGSRLGGNTGQYFLRFMGVDGFILSRDVVARLIAEDIIDKAPTSQKALTQVQNAFNILSQQSGRSLTHISRVLAMSL